MTDDASTTAEPEGNEDPDTEAADPEKPEAEAPNETDANEENEPENGKNEPEDEEAAPEDEETAPEDEEDEPEGEEAEETETPESDDSDNSGTAPAEYPGEGDDSELLEGRYRIEEALGDGAMGQVFRAEHVMMEKTVAVKVLHDQMLDNQEMVARFQREARAAAALAHPNVCQATDFGQREDGSFFLVMEYLDGRTLQDVMEQHGALDVERALNIASQIGSALAEAHDEGIVHRDLKPENVMLVDRGGETDTVKIMDFGIARIVAGAEEDDEGAETRLTREGMVYGTPHYMSPEQVAGEDVDTSTDLYALGVVLFEMIAGQPPFDGDAIARVMGQHVTEPVPPIRSHRSELAGPVAELVEELLAKAPEDRPGGADEVVERIEAIDDPTGSDGELTRRFDEVVDRARQEGKRAADSLGPGVEKASEKLGPTIDQTASTSREIARKSLSTARVAATKVSQHARAGATTALRHARSAGKTAAEKWEELPEFERRVVAALSVAFVALVVTVTIVLSVVFSAERQAEAVHDDRQVLLEDEEIETAIDNAEAGDRSALDELLEDRQDDPHLRYLAMEADLTAHRHVDVVDEAEQILELDDRYAHDPDLVERLVDRLVHSDADEAREVLLEHMSSTILDELAYRTRKANSAMRDAAFELLDEEGLLGDLDDWQRVTARMRQTWNCSEIEEYLEQLRAIGDPDAVPMLERYRDMSARHCGTLNMRDCLSCVRDDLPEVIEELNDD